MDSTACFFLSTYTPDGWNSLGAHLRQETRQDDACLLLGGPGCEGAALLQKAADTAVKQGCKTEVFLSPTVPCLPEAIRLPERHVFAAIAEPFGGTVPPVPGPNEYYVNLTACYDRSALRALQEQVAVCQQEEAQHTDRAARCLRATEQLTQDMRASLLTPDLQARLGKRAAGILTREFRAIHGKGSIRFRYLSAYTGHGCLTLFDTVSTVCSRVWVLMDSYGLAHDLLSPIAAGASAAGYDVIACLSPLEVQRLEHVLIPSLSLAFVTSSPVTPWHGDSERHIRLDSMLDTEQLRKQRGRLRLNRKMIAALEADATAELAQAAELHQIMEELFGAYVDPDAMQQLQTESINTILSVSE